MKYKKEDLERMIWVEKLPYTKIAEFYGVSDTYIKKVASKLGIPLQSRAKFPDNWVPHNKGTAKVVFCEVCGEQCDYFSNKFCSTKCMGKARKLKTMEKYENCVKNNENISVHGKTLKNFILNEQDNKCAICYNSNKWQEKELVLVLDHIDGNADNNKRDNLRLVCPNCDSQLPTFKSKNKNSARKKRYLMNYKNLTEQDIEEHLKLKNDK